ncbi:SprT family protein [Pediococcus inopinatus]|jgi:SprT-like protein|uniref:SprT family protein n=1 Tax=Pediococcus inopinatus TaxID=114090 RepID=UPI000708B642|nr:SprT family protein [Pediococcus inopinatus]AVL00495.1 SprT family protein [Pediococcus inopinatus]WPC18150.1 SprT family protein [Pediococcus inopinatus]
MTDTELQQLVEKISLSDFHRQFKHHAFFNQRLRTTGGRYQLQTHDIDINPKMLSEHDLSTLVGIIRHELCHYHLHLTHHGYQHRDSDFRQLLAQVHGSRFAPAVQASSRSRMQLVYRCQQCGLQYHRKRHIDLKKYRCGKCGGQLRLIQTLRK